MRNRKTQRQLAKNDKALDKNPNLAYSKPKELTNIDPNKRVYGSFESNKK